MRVIVVRSKDDGYENIFKISSDGRRDEIYLPTFLIHLGGQVGGQRGYRAKPHKNVRKLKY